MRAISSSINNEVAMRSMVVESGFKDPTYPDRLLRREKLVCKEL